MNAPVGPTSVMTLGARPRDVESPAARGEPGGGESGGDGVLDEAFDVRRQHEVADDPTLTAHRVVVVAEDVLGTFEAGSFVEADDSPHDVHRLEIGEVSVQRTLGSLLIPRQEFGDRRRTAGAKHLIDQRSAARRVQLPGGLQPTGDQLMSLDD